MCWLMLMNEKGTLEFLFWTIILSSTGTCLDLVYMESSCGTSNSLQTSFHMDSSTGMTYRNSLDCTYTVTVPTGHFVLAVVTRFEIEAPLTGSCTDYLEVFDGSDGSATALTSAGGLCGSGNSIPANWTSSGQSMTFRLVTDNSGVYMGFNLVFAAVHNAPCIGDEVNCNNSLCIDSSLACDGYNQCGDTSDEDSCTDIVDNNGVDIVMIVVIALAVVVFITLVTVYIIYRFYEDKKWKRFLNGQNDKEFTDGIVEPGSSYPVTHRYYKGVRAHPSYGSSVLPTDSNAHKFADADKGANDTVVIPATSSPVV